MAKWLMEILNKLELKTHILASTGGDPDSMKRTEHLLTCEQAHNEIIKAIKERMPNCDDDFMKYNHEYKDGYDKALNDVLKALEVE